MPELVSPRHETNSRFLWIQMLAGPVVRSFPVKLPPGGSCLSGRVELQHPGAERSFFYRDRTDCPDRHRYAFVRPPIVSRLEESTPRPQPEAGVPRKLFLVRRINGLHVFQRSVVERSVCRDHSYGWTARSLFAALLMDWEGLSDKFFLFSPSLLLLFVWNNADMPIAFHKRFLDLRPILQALLAQLTL